jgi:23S rRNA (guanosine2251-2'-O)-methyltransferase
MIIYGLRPILYYAVHFPEDVNEIFIARKDRLAEIKKEIPKGVKITLADETFFQGKLADVNHQGIAANVHEFRYVDLEDISFTSHSLVLILDGIQDPANLGAILRTAEAFSVDMIVIPKDRAASITPAVIRASSGAARGVKVCMAVNITRAILSLKDKGFWVAAVDIRKDAVPIYEYDMKGSVAFILGAEDKGIRRRPMEQADSTVTIPMSGKVESLNVSATAAAILSEATRQRSTLIK